MVTSYSRGHEIYHDALLNEWKYVDTNEVINNIRPCAKCSKQPIFIKDVGYVDACTGYVEGATSVCCGHGVDKEILITHQK